jgi:hypothetical protein
VLGRVLHDRIGSKTVIVGSLVAMIRAGLTLMALSGARGQRQITFPSASFWVCGLLLCLIIAPTQSSARTLLLRMAKDGMEGLAFGAVHDDRPGRRSECRGCFPPSSVCSTPTAPAWVGFARCWPDAQPGWRSQHRIPTRSP